MRGNPPSASGLVLASVMCGLSFLCAFGSAFAQSPEAAGSASEDTAERRFTFDIPAQSLDMALDRFSTVSGRAAVFSSALVAGRMATAVSGRYTPLEALRLLVSGTGLVVETASSQGVTTFVLVPGGAATLEREARQRAERARLADYDALVQSEVWQAICDNPRTALARYRALLRFRVAPDGQVVDVTILSAQSTPSASSTSSASSAKSGPPMNRPLIDTLSRVRISQPPMPDLPQPIAMLILPESPDGPACRPGGHQP